MRIQFVSKPHHASLVELLCEVHSYYNEGSHVSLETVNSYLVETLLAAGSPLKLVVASPDGKHVSGLAAISLTYSLVEPTPDRSRHCWLKELYVRQEERGAGTGQALMSWVARYAVENGCCRIDWPVKESNVEGIAFYERLGASRVAERLSFRLAEPALSRLAAESAG